MRIARSEDWDRPELAQKGTTPTGEFRVSHLFQPEHPGDIQAYLVRSYSHHAEVGLHFHEHSQFQVFVDGEGTFQRHRVGPVTVHFTDPYSTYGPIVAGDDGLSFFVLRVEEDAGGRYMPGSRDKLVGRPGRNLSVESPADGVGSFEVIPEHPDGLRAQALHVAPGASASLPDVAGCAGQFALLLAGSGRVGGTELSRWGLVYQEPGAQGVRVDAGDDGVRVLVMRFPDKAAA